MAKNPLFSTYRQGENRVTSSMLAVFERVDLSLLEQLLAAATGEAALTTVTFINQPPGAGASVPDARISARFAWWFEVKTERGALRRDQLVEHLANLTDPAADERLFVVTPDAVEPGVVADLADPRLVWFSFRALTDAIDTVLGDPTGLVAEQTRFLLRELQALLEADGLLDTDDVVVVAARVAYGEYQNHVVYVCQPGRAFRRGLTHLGFYTDGAIQPLVPRIVAVADNVPFTAEEAAHRRATGDPIEARIAATIDAGLEQAPGAGLRTPGETYQVFLLSPPDDPATVRLVGPIVNDTVGRGGRTFAWTMGQRYVSLTRLTSGAAKTSEL